MLGTPPQEVITFFKPSQRKRDACRVDAEIALKPPGFFGRRNAGPNTAPVAAVAAYGSGTP